MATKQSPKALDKFDGVVKKWAARLGAIASIIGVVVAASTWFLAQINNIVVAKIEDQISYTEEKIEEISEKSEARTHQVDLQLTRLELMSLIHNNPENVVGIEKLARHYFRDLDGDTYMTSEYSEYCRKYGADCEIMVH